MKIVADENIPFVQEAFGPLGDVKLMPGRKIAAADVQDADALLVRSVTNVNGALLNRSRVRFVATATIGTDHVDEAYLQHAQIAFASAQGSNANSVGEYVLTATYSLFPQELTTPRKRTVGVIGCGNVGRRVVQYFRQLGHPVWVCDPPLERLIQTTGHGHKNEALPEWVQNERFWALDVLLEQAHVLTLHVPLTQTGPDATRHLLDAARLSRLHRHLLLNTSRGAVVDNSVVAEWLRANPESQLVLDVWENEPNICWELLDEPQLRFVTPHIAGYSFDGKVAGTRMIYEALCQYMGLVPVWDGKPHLGEPGSLPLAVQLQNQSDSEAFVACLQAGYDLLGDDRRMREAARLPAEERAKGFDHLRKSYPLRREFYHYTVTLPADRKALMAALSTVGFHIRTANP